jgi:hypothetical protein
MENDHAALDRIKCPNCGELFPVSEAIYHQIAEKTRDELKAESIRQHKAFAARDKELKEKEDAFEATVQERLRAARRGIEIDAENKARNLLSLEIQDLRCQAAEKDLKLAEAGAAELELRKQKRQLEEKASFLELDVARKIDAERASIQEETARRLGEEHRLHDAEKDKKLQDAMRMNEELRRKLLQGSQQTQGEVLELELEGLIAASFPSDQVAPVPKGIRGADVIQRVMSRSGHICGTIVWESKRTKAWSDAWIQKLKDDQRAVKADIAVLLSEALPKDCTNFGMYDGVWIATPQLAISLAIALRAQLIEVAMAKLAAVGKNEKMEILYQYISGSEFRQRVEAIVEAFVAMQEDLQEERRIAERRVGSAGEAYSKGDFKHIRHVRRLSGPHRVVVANHSIFDNPAIAVIA